MASTSKAVDNHIGLSSGARRRVRADDYLSRRSDRTELVRSIRDSASRHGLAVLCAEPGMGSHVLLDLVAAGYERDCCIVTRFRYSSRSHESSYRRLRKCLSSAVDLSAQGLRPVVCISDVDQLTESGASRVARVVNGLVLCGSLVILQAMPDSDIVLERLPECQVFRSVDLLVTRDDLLTWPGAYSCGATELMLKASGGVVSLVSALIDDGGTHGVLDPVARGRAWREAMRKLLAHALGERLVDEERALRAAMLVLGRGSLGDIRRAGVRAELDVAASIERDAPIFGMRASLGEFECVPTDVSLAADLVGDCLPAHALRRLCSTLVERGEYGRVGVVSQLCLDERDRVRVVRSHPVELLESGAVGLVAANLGSAATAEGEVPCQAPGSTAMAEAARALLALYGAEEDAAAAPARLEQAGAGDTGETPGGAASGKYGLIAALARACSEPLDASDETQARTARSLARRAGGSGNATCRGLSTLLGARTLMARGHALEAFRMLVAAGDLVMAPRGAATLSGALLRCEFELARLIVGDPMHARDAAALRRAQALVRSGLGASRASEIEGFRDAVATLCGAGDEAVATDRLGQLAAEFEGGGDYLRAAVTSLAVATRDLDARSWRRAAVVAGAALERARRAGASDVGASALALQRLALKASGDSIDELGLAWDPASDDERCSEDVRLATRLADAVREGDADGLREVGAAMEGLSPRIEAQLLVALLVRVDAHMRPAAMGRMPAGWKERVAKAVVPKESPRFNGRDATGEGPGTEGAITVCVLGGLRVRRGEHSLTETAWRRSSARALLGMLALAPGHALGRFEAAEMLWPEASYARAREGLYTTISALRRTLKALGDERYVQGEEGMIWLARDLVSYDVDELRGLVRMALAGTTSDDGIVAAGLRLEGLYGGGTWIPTADATGLFRRYHDEVSAEYVEALAAASEAAWRLGRLRTCAWLARAAHLESPLREDVAARLVEALAADGRLSEARDVYLAYSARCVRELGTPPSERLRQAGQSVLPAMGGADSVPVSLSSEARVCGLTLPPSSPSPAESRPGAQNVAPVRQTPCPAVTGQPLGKVNGTVPQRRLCPSDAETP